MADTRNSSVSKHAQQSLPRFRTIPRGVISLGFDLGSTSRRSSVDEKNGKSGSTHGAQGSAAAKAYPTSNRQEREMKRRTFKWIGGQAALFLIVILFLICLDQIGVRLRLGLRGTVLPPWLAEIGRNLRSVLSDLLHFHRPAVIP